MGSRRGAPGVSGRRKSGIDIRISGLARGTIQGTVRGGQLVVSWALKIRDLVGGLIPWILGGEKVVSYYGI